MKDQLRTEVQDTILAKGFKFLSFAVFKFINVKAAAPSFKPEALPAVTVPFSLKTVFRVDNFYISSNLRIFVCIKHFSVFNFMEQFHF